MVEIIKRGTLREKKMQYTCPNCGCIFSFTLEDLLAVPFWQSNVKGYILCPQCGRKIFINKIEEEDESIHE